MDFLGVKNVIDAKAIFGADGIADGFNISFLESRKMRNGKIKQVEKQKTIWVREFDQNSVSNDGTLHGFGRGTIYKRTTSKPRVKKSNVNLSAIQKYISK